MAIEMTSFTSVSDAARAIQDFLFDRDAALPDDVRERLITLVGPATSPVDAVVTGAELLYARQDELDPKAKVLAAGLALVAQQYNFHGMAQDNRGSKLALAMMREAKVKKAEGVEYPDKDKDPERKVEFMPQPTPDPEAPAPVVVPTPDTPVEDTPPAEGTRRGRGRRDRNATNTS